MESAFFTEHQSRCHCWLASLLITGTAWEGRSGLWLTKGAWIFSCLANHLLAEVVRCMLTADYQLGCCIDFREAIMMILWSWLAWAGASRWHSYSRH